MAHDTGPGARRAGGAARRAARRAQGRPRRAGHHRGREDHLGGPRRGAGDDRHLRVRRRAVAAAVRQDHRLRACRAPADGDLASARRRRRHHRLQLPRRGVGVERRDRAGVRRHRGVEAVGAHAADRAGLPGAGRARRRRRRSTACGEPADHGWARGRRTTGRRPAGGAAERDRVGADGSAGRPAGGATLRPGAAGTRRQQRRHRHAVGGSRPGRSGHRVLRGGHRGPALHDACAG